MFECEVLFTESKVRDAIHTNAMMLHGAVINDFKPAPIVALGVLGGCYPFMSTFLEQFPAREHVRIAHARPAGNDFDFFPGHGILKGAMVIVLDDICDSGVTLDKLVKTIEYLCEGDVQILTCCITNRRERHPGVTVHFPCLRIPKEAGWIIGWGMDRECGDSRYLMDIAHIPPKAESTEDLSWLNE